MRRVFHGSIQVITSPLVNVGRENLDFGKGFYVTDIRRQAQTWAEVKRRYYFEATAFINEYAFDFEGAVNDCNYKKFGAYDSEWLHFIVDCRNGIKVWKNYDIIEGGVANDRVIDTVEAFKAGQVTEEIALRELSRHQPNNQICFLRQEVVDKYLVFKKSVVL